MSRFSVFLGILWNPGFSSCYLTYENCNESSGFFNEVQAEWTDLRNSNGIKIRSFYFANVQKLFRKFLPEVENALRGANLGSSKLNK